jgi:hypothetical protein
MPPRESVHLPTAEPTAEATEESGDQGRERRIRKRAATPAGTGGYGRDPWRRKRSTIAAAVKEIGDGVKESGGVGREQ